MPVTNCNTVNGKIVSQHVVGQPASSQIDYATDALGCVVATTDQAGAVVNTYRYKPYGSLLAKTGTAPDPMFTWVGSYGYRQTAKTYSDVYVRARHYASQIGRWTTKDPANYDNVLYGYVNAAPVSNIDPSGLLTIVYAARTDQIPACGFYDVYFGFLLDKPAPCSGYFVQYVSYTATASLCGNQQGPVNTGVPSQTFYWEAFPVNKGDRWVSYDDGPDFSRGNYADEAKYRGTGSNTVGQAGQTRILKFFCDTVTGDLDIKWMPPATNLSGILPSTSVRPKWWNQQSSNGEGSANSSASSQWCCCGPQDQWINPSPVYVPGQ